MAKIISQTLFQVEHVILEEFYFYRYKGKNVVSIDETAWRARSDKRKVYWPKGYERRESSEQES